eukprot:364788-Chlamydomonas_euryale.AAC.9
MLGALDLMGWLLMLRPPADRPPEEGTAGNVTSKTAATGTARRGRRTALHQVCDASSMHEEVSHPVRSPHPIATQALLKNRPVDAEHVCSCATTASAAPASMQHEDGGGRTHAPVFGAASQQRPRLKVPRSTHSH